MRLAALVLALILAAGPLHAQRSAGIELVLPPHTLLTTVGPLVRSTGILTNRQTRDLLRSGFPARLHYRVELWSTEGLFDNLKQRVEWDVVVRHDPLHGAYEVARIVDGHVTSLGSFADVQSAEDALGVGYRVPIAPGSRNERYYYSGALDVEMLSLGDLDEVERWLKGELRPAVRGQRNPGTALTRGVRTLLVRLLGGETRQYEGRSPTFRPPR